MLATITFTGENRDLKIALIAACSDGPAIHFTY